MSRPLPARIRSSIRSDQAVPSRHGVHCPQDSWAKNRQELWRKSTMLTVSSMTTTAAVPRPRQPTLPGPAKSSGVSSSASVSNPIESPPGITAFAFRPFHTPPPWPSMSWRAVMPRGAS